MQDWGLRYFAPREFACNCGCGGGFKDMHAPFMAKLDMLRHEFGAPIILTSAYRCRIHNDRVSSTGLTGPHTTGRAVDIRISGEPAYQLLRLAIQSFRFTGVGVKQTGRHSSRFIHLDHCTPSQAARPMIWSY